MTLTEEDLTLHELALLLHLPLYRLKVEMPYEELLGWMAYFERRPIGWREDDRAFKLMQAQGVKIKPHEAFGSLATMYAHQQETAKETDTLKQSRMYQLIMTAQGGEQIPL